MTTGAAAKPEILISPGPETIRAVVKAIQAGYIPETYVCDGRIMHLEEVSGSASAMSGDEDSPLPVAATEVGAPLLARLLAEHTMTFRIIKGGDEEEVTPPFPALTAALAAKTWPDVQTFRGIVGAPVLRPDGTLLQRPGYDKATGLYLASKVPLDVIPDAPTRQQVETARAFLLDKFLHDFPWVEDADRANYVGVLVTPILRRFLRALIPFVVYTATMPGSGKTILTSGPGMLYGQRVLTWTNSDEELRKSITSVLADPAGAVIFDNLAEGTVIDSPVLARLITDRTWADRLLGKNITASYSNDRVWAATGNNLLLGGDMATRTVLIRLNPDMPKPEERTGFAIPNLDDWILQPANQRKMLFHLLVLVIDWTRKGAPRQSGLTMRQFTPWAEAIGGFLGFHGIKGFLDNVETVRDIDDENATWTAFLARWYDRHQESAMTTHQLCQDAHPVYGDDPWGGLFLTDARGKPPSEVSLGKRLKGHIGRYHGSYVLRSDQDRHSKVRTWWVEEWSG